MQTPQNLSELESAIASALEDTTSVEMSGWVSTISVQEAAKELLAAIAECEVTGKPLTPCQKLMGEWIIHHCQRAHDTWWK